MNLLDHSTSFSPEEDFAAFLERVPARWVVYLLSDEQGRPFQLLYVRNLRASLANRLCEHPADEKTKSVPYRQVVRQVAWHPVDSAAEAEWVYVSIVRELFPQAYTKLMDSWRCCYLAIDPAAKFPRYQVTDTPDPALLPTTFGPIPHRNAAGKLIETIEDAFDLCRYYPILTQAPRGAACAYKQMHKCPAPCDGSVSLGMYHQLIGLSLQALINNSEVIADHELRMRQAAAAMKFELAGKIRGYVDQLRSLAAGPFEHLRPLSTLRTCAILRASKAKRFKLMLLTPECIEVSAEWAKPEEITDTLSRFSDRCHEPGSRDALALDRLTFLCRQILQANPDCVFVPPEPSAIQAAMAQLSRRKAIADTADEGIVQEAQ